ncbi:MAG: hypothetical protein A3J94_02355 [Syntrophus sp. RIFOXYC2_FULL_54_9]|nr:MAG: hypothetical protein A3J94_02355 [Syntrophus sp. RIFOXYC2_FULL_54_9]HBB15849.1 hypothetical protein [Syntrophus sp. (in: bacteria)]
MGYPKWIAVRQNLDRKRLDDPYLSTYNQLTAQPDGLFAWRDARIAITAGSRYISNLTSITKAVVDYISSKGGHPFLVPAMGSHGGATGRGQIKVLEEMGLTEDTLGVPVVSSMEVVRLGAVEGIPVYMDGNAHAADGVVVINRIKPHQVFKGEIQSGLNKMLVVGLGKKEGADAVHASGRTDVLGAMGDFIRSAVPVIFGVAILENSYDETRDVAVVTPDAFKAFDAAWVKESRLLMPKIPIRKLDMVIVERMGKDISGSGMDTNVIGFTRRLVVTGQVAVPLAVLELTEKSEGNAMGIGLADFTTRRLVEKIDYRATYTNVLASGVYSAGRIPVTFENEKEILDAVLHKMEHPEKARIIRIKNTLELDRFLVTEALIGEVLEQKQLEVCGEWTETCFDEIGDMVADGLISAS